MNLTKYRAVVRPTFKGGGGGGHLFGNFFTVTGVSNTASSVCSVDWRAVSRKNSQLSVAVMFMFVALGARESAFCLNSVT